MKLAVEEYEEKEPIVIVSLELKILLVNLYSISSQAFWCQKVSLVKESLITLHNHKNCDNVFTKLFLLNMRHN